MKRRLSRRRLAIVLAAASVIPVANAFAPAQASDRHEEPAAVHGISASGMRHSLQHSRLGAPPSAGAAGHFVDAPTHVVGVYGGTVLDMLPGGSLVLVKWPDGSPHERWKTGVRMKSLPANSRKDGAHIFFLWPES